MNSAYVILGIPGNATAADIEDAFQRARTTYTPERMAEDSRVAQQLTDVMDAYKVLRDPEARAAHDRKLASQVRVQQVQRSRIDPQPVMERESSMPKVLMFIGALVAALFAGGFYVQHQRQAAQAELAAKALETARQQAIAEAENQKTLALEVRESARREAAEQARDRAFRRESDAAIARAQSNQARQNALDAQQQSAALREEQRKEYERRADEQRRANEGQRRVAADRQRIRELCYINYRRYDC
ncbi:DnaJ domain-containing protein [Variovorax sp. LjRoot290]|uniref:DnaJ domain-containing protein n=1 Tax=unclassified Variovorax TaxID=663243 RepID=UPI003ECE7BB2